MDTLSLCFSSHTPRLHEHTIGSWVFGLNSFDGHKYRTGLTERSQAFTKLPLSTFHLEPPALPDPTWITASWRPFVARRILVLRVIMSSILAPCQAWESAATARRTLMMSPESSHLRYKAVLVFARALMCGHLPLVHSAYAKKPVNQISAFFIGLSPSPLMLLPCLANVAFCSIFFGFVGFRLPLIQQSFLELGGWYNRCNLLCNKPPGYGMLIV